MEETGQQSLTGKPVVTEASLRNQVRAKQIAQGIIDGKTYTQIARDMDLDRSHLYSIMDKQEVRELMTLEVRELETKLQTWITELQATRWIT